MFIGRENELADLNDMYNQNKFQLFVLYGRRRVGKTTLINLLLRFYELNDGKILIDDIDIKESILGKY